MNFSLVFAIKYVTIVLIKNGMPLNACSVSSSTIAELLHDMGKNLLITWRCCHFPLYFYGSDETLTEPSRGEFLYF